MICVFKCMGCGNKMHYSIEHKRLECPTCGGNCKVEDYDTSAITYEGISYLPNELKQLACPSCGATMTVMDVDAKIECSYCGNEMAAFGVREGEICPEKIISCKLTLEEAKGKMLSWWVKHPTMPKADQKKLKMKFQMYYVPVWLYNADVVTTISAEVAPYEVDQEDINPMTTVFDHIVLTTEGHYFNVPFDSSAHFIDERFHGIEPFTFAEMEDFQPAYLSGHAAERYYYEQNELLGKAILRIQKQGLEECRVCIESHKNGGIITDLVDQQCDVTPKEVIYTLVPVWVCNYTYMGKKHSIYINGQNGKVDGEILSVGKVFQMQMLLFTVSSIFAWVTAFNLAFRLLFVFAFIGLLLLIGILQIAESNEEYKAKRKTSAKINSASTRLRIVDFKLSVLARLVIGAICLATLIPIVVSQHRWGMNLTIQNFLLPSLIGFAVALVESIFFAIRLQKKNTHREVVDDMNYIRFGSSNVIECHMI